ncbi:hypothetical protein VCX68_23845 [Aeromonas caviae]|uniref:hypothetical protein n=1 Tax=Aeromonas caviae TaxID=648 RepID=UPI002B247953|nr:hypothetical protein [Aeromonas caviae]MEA9429415.1 hypothetical protein [Aeromonas caviae]
MIDSLEQDLEGRSSDQLDVIEPREQHQTNAGVKSILAGFLAGGVMSEMMCIYIGFSGHQTPVTARARTVAG